MLIPARDVGVNRMFTDPKTGKLYIMRAYDSEENKCLAEDPDGGFWDCKGFYQVNLEPEPKTDG